MSVFKTESDCTAFSPGSSTRRLWEAVCIVSCLAAWILTGPAVAAPSRQTPQARTGTAAAAKTAAPANSGGAETAAPSSQGDGDDAPEEETPEDLTPGKGRKTHPWGTEIHAEVRTSRVRPLKNEKTRRILVITPPAYDDARTASTRYPVFYLLHGSPGKPSNFVNFGHWPSLMQEMVQAGVTQQAIFVIPDGNYAGEHHGDSEWANSADGRDLFENYVAKDIVSWADANFRTIPDAPHRILVGVSEGAYGAVNIAMREPGVFGAAVSLSGYFRNDGSGWARPVMGYDPEWLRQNSPLDYVNTGLGRGRDAAAWRGTRFFLGAGDDEAHYIEETRKMAARMKDAGLDVTLRVENGKHGWGLWGQLFQDAVPTVLSPNKEDAQSTGSEPAP